MGLVNYIVEEPDDLLAKTREILSIINGKAPLAVARVIECVNIAAGDGNPAGSDAWEADPFGGDARPDDNSGAHHSGDTDDSGDVIIDGFLREQEAFGECFATQDMQEGANAFLNKRKPNFTGH